jgi:hemolysin III
MKTQTIKPRLRGYLHQEAFYISLGACALLIAQSSTLKTLVASLVYSMGLLLLFGFSAFYHRLHWEPQVRRILKRIDHSAIFILIAGTVTPIALLALSDLEGTRLLWAVWSAAAIGIILSVLWVSAPKWVTALLCVVAGWVCSPYIGSLKETLSMTDLAFLIAGGLVYSVGALFYALRKPNWFPGTFGYHELFHLFTIIAAMLHFIVVYKLVVKA